MANSGRAEGSHQNSGLCLSSACNGCSRDFTFWCGVEWWVTRQAGTRNGTIHYKLQIYTASSHFITYGLHKYDTYLNGYPFGTIPDTSNYSDSTNRWYDLAGVTASQSFTYNDDGTAPGVRINGGGAGFGCTPFCMGRYNTSIGGFDVYPDRVTVDWNRKPGGITGSSSNVTCTGIKLNFNVGDPGIPSNITTRILYGTTTSYGQSTATSNARSGSFTLSGLQPGTTYHYKVRTTNSTGTTDSGDYTFKTKGTPPSAGNPSAINPAVYRLDFSLPNIVWQGSDGCTTTSRAATLTWKYTMDGRNYSFSHNWSGNNLGNSLSYSTGVDINKVPDDETVTYTWTLTTNIGTWTKTGTIYCQPSYEAWVCSPNTNYQWKECELYASEKAGVASYKKVRWVRSIT